MERQFVCGIPAKSAIASSIESRVFAGFLQLATQ